MLSPPATRCGLAILIPESDSAKSANHSSDPSHDMWGWLQVTQAKCEPSGEGRGAATKSPASTRGTSRNEPSVATDTNRCPVPELPCRSSTQINQPPVPLPMDHNWPGSPGI